MSIIGQTVLNLTYKIFWIREPLNYRMLLTNEEYQIYICNDCLMRKIKKSIYFKNKTIYSKSNDPV